jgi:hypothetical protein
VTAQPPAQAAIPPPAKLLVPVRLFDPSDFTSSRAADPTTKARFATQFSRFVVNGFSAQQLPAWFHKLLVQTFGLPRHASRIDLLSRWFSNPATNAEFIQRLLAYVPAGRPDRGLTDVEIQLQQWLRTSGAAIEIIHRSANLAEATERHLLRVLLARYPDELQRLRGAAPQAPMQPDLFPELAP